MGAARGILGLKFLMTQLTNFTQNAIQYVKAAINHRISASTSAHA